MINAVIGGSIAAVIVIGSAMFWMNILGEGGTFRERLRWWMR